MQISLSDLVDSCSEDIYLELNTSDEHVIDELKFLKDFKKLLKQYNKPTNQIDYFISKLEGNMDFENVIHIFDIDEKSIKKKIEKHPYFKNPCDYPIRLVTIMKYLKKKGVDIDYKDMDLIVDKLIQQIDGVKKVGDGMYLKKSN
ncbi:hypothetical protein FQB35_08355 [Crassaminicella thermophila]|uniref:Uncharacterized protein n=1 Tax=Crassaminicella thermophila TaxID=2599308 RepID=A0A5C0SF36_CRATE|nr:hypothetical protein [Crassaminicella thermophila]QEK12386.1 hypothetical protein FQB35_08355 [Crassaminicella thermophila]